VTNRIASALGAHFEKYRIVFWYDAKKELRSEFDALSLPDVVKLEIANNEYALKYRILREEYKQKFLLYHEGPQPEDLQNWLLDVLLSYGEFRTDQVSIWLSELELGLEFFDVLQDHMEFFRTVKRRDALMDEILKNLLHEQAVEHDEIFATVERCGLAEFFWQQLKDVYGYQSSSPSLQDLRWNCLNPAMPWI
jgi:hypothetical protein